MGNNLQKYQPKEVLNKVLNDNEDALKVDDIATIKADIALMKADIASMKVTTDKLDACINGSNQLEVKNN